MLKVSVVVPVKDRFPLAQICLNSILNQERAVNEVVVVDDGSISPAIEFFGETQARAATLGIDMRFVRNEVNKGVSASRNIGFHASSGDVVSFCDSDDFWIPQKAGFVCATFDDARVRVHFHAFAWCCGTLRAFKLLPKDRMLRLPRFLLVVFSVLSPSCMSVRRDAFGAGYAEDMRYHEDLEFALRISQAEDVFFFNFPFTILGRSAGSEGGETVNTRRMREGAVEALQRLRGGAVLQLLARLKIRFHRIKIAKMK